MKRALLVGGLILLAVLAVFGWVYYASYPAFAKSRDYFNQIPVYQSAKIINSPNILAPLTTTDYGVTYQTTTGWTDLFTWYYQHMPPIWHASGRDNGGEEQVVSFSNENDSYKVTFRYNTHADSSGNYNYSVTVTAK